MGDPAEENDPPPESPEFLTNEIQSVNRKVKKNTLRTLHGRMMIWLNDLFGKWGGAGRNTGIPMTEKVAGQNGIPGINKINRVAGTSPGIH
jgi:hypothetical protein